MVTEDSASPQPDEDIKRVPPQRELRDRLRLAARHTAAALDHHRPPSRELLQSLATDLLQGMALPRAYLGFTMVAINNAFWREQFQAVPLHRRLLLLPRCLRDPQRCQAAIDAAGLHCRHCGACPIADLTSRARASGYQVVVAEGTSAVLTRVLRNQADAILGVGCLDSLDRSFQTVVDLGVPNQAIPLLQDGCVHTQVEVDLITSALLAVSAPPPQATQTPLPLLRETVAVFEPAQLTGLLAPFLSADASADDPLTATDAIALDWLREGGKRLRPFVTVASWVVGRHGSMALAPDADVAALLPDSVRRLAIAIEALHKASLVHDDIEDDDPHRYGRPTLHRTWGPGVAINVGDYLVGLGYRLIAAEEEQFGCHCVADMLQSLSAAHLQLCRGQGAELLWQRGQRLLRPTDALTIAARKTAPAFEAALYCGLRAAGAEIPDQALRRFSLYLGQAYQALNDLDDWTADDGNKLALGRDVISARPTILRAFALQAGGGEALARLAHETDLQALVEGVRALYSVLGVFERADALVAALRRRALQVAEALPSRALAELFEFLVRTVLRRSHRHGA